MICSHNNQDTKWERCSCATVLHTQILQWEKRSLRCADKPVSTVRLPLLLKGTSTEHSGQKHWGAAWGMTLPFSACSQSLSCGTVLHIQILWEKRWSPRSSITPVSIGKTALLLKIQAQDGPTQSHQNRRTKEQLGTGTFWILSAPCRWQCAKDLHTKIPPGENWSRKSSDKLAWRRYKPQSKTDQLTEIKK